MSVSPLPVCLTNSFASHRPPFSDSSPKNCTFHFRHWPLYSSYSPKVSTNGGVGACADAFLTCKGWCAHPGGGDTCPPPLSVAPCKPTTPRSYPSPGASKLCPPGAAWTHTDPSRPQCRSTLGPGLHPAPTPRLGSTSQGTHFARSSGSPDSRVQRKRNLRRAPEKPRKPPHRASRGCHGNSASAPASRTHLRLRKSTEYPRTRKLHSHSTQDAPRCLRRDVTTDVTTRD